ncbi:Pau6p, partial [Saccharomyces cerevisiae YJM450]
MVKLTSIA